MGPGGPMRFRLLGPVEVLADDGSPLSLNSERERTLVAALVLAANRPVTASRLMEALWADDPPATAANALQVHVSRLRKKLSTAGATDRLSSTAQGYLLLTRPGEVDVDRFQHLAAQQDPRPARVRARLDEALGLWRGTAISNVTSEYLRGEQVRLEELRRLAIERRIDAMLDLGRHDELVGELESLVHAEPLQDGYRRRLMLTLYRSGRQTQSLTVYRQGRELLSEELGLDPSPELQALELAILRHDPELAAATPASDALTGDRIEGVGDDGESTEDLAREVTLLFTDIEDAARLWDLYPDEMREALILHDALVREEIELAGGRIFKTVGDAFCAEFDRAEDGARAAIECQQKLGAQAFPDPISIRVRMALHTAVCDRRDDDLFGPAVNRVARLEAVAHGGQTLASQAASIQLRANAPQIELVQLGEHRLRDLGQPETVFQIQVPGAPEVFPPLRSLDDPVVRHNLPAQISTFVGRVREISKLRDLVSDSRLVTLCGSGGSGKTRLALQLAAEFVDGTGDGVWFVDCSPLSSPELVAASLASVLGVGEETGQGIDQTVAQALARSQMLVVLDNCEHLIDACAKLADTILRSCPGVHIVATSREPLGIGGERIHRVASLTLPPADLSDPDKIAGFDSVELFVNRARLTRPEFGVDPSNASTVASLCRRLDGIPLALELAAARLRSLSVDQVIEGLDDGFGLLSTGPRTSVDRHRTLDALVAWSYALLNESEQELLVRLSVFAGGFSLSEVEVVCGEFGSAFDVTDLVASLVDKSLVEFDPSNPDHGPRYRLLETIRAYAAARASEWSEGDVRALRAVHARAFQELASTAAPRLREDDQASWVRRLDLDHDNLRSALEHFLGEDDRESALSMAIDLNYFWRNRGYYSEGIEYLERGLTCGQHSASTELELTALVAEGALRLRRGDGRVVHDVLHGAVDRARQLGLDVLAADALAELAYLEGRLGELDVAVQLANESVELARRGDDVHILSDSLSVRASLFDRAERPGARQLWGEALAASRRAGDPRLTAVILNNLAGRDMREEDLAAARLHLEDALAIGRNLRYDGLNSTTLTNLGLVAVMQHDYEAAFDLYREALEVSHRIGSLSNMAYSLHGLGLCQSGSGDARTALAFHSISASLFEKTGETLDAQESALRDGDLEKIRESIGNEAFEEEYERGQGRSLDDVLRLALSTPLGSAE
jgi:predicted ATPase/DNA-binding SARP family transcriptional activator